MKKLILAAAFTLAASSARATDVGVSVGVNDSGVYGRIEVGTAPRPVVVNPQPVIVQRTSVDEGEHPPVYMRVPPGHARHWRKHCRQYNACGEPVLFVDERWYTDVYLPHHRAEQAAAGGDHGEMREHHHGHGKGKKDD